MPAKEILTAMLEEFPGFREETEDNPPEEVNGGDLVEWLSERLVDWNGR